MGKAKELTKWKKMNESLLNFQEYILNKQVKYELSLIDLLFISNFKGGNASIHENSDRLKKILPVYSQNLKKLILKYGERCINELDDTEVETLTKDLLNFCQLTNDEETAIDGFKSSYTSALLHAFLPNVVPILDRRILIGLDIVSKKDIISSTGQVRDILMFYPLLIRKVWEISKTSHRSIREIDMEYFTKPFPDWIKRANISKQ